MALRTHSPASITSLPLGAEKEPPREAEAYLVVALREGDDTALDAIMLRWEKPLFSFAWRYLHNTADAHDLVADTFVRLHRHRYDLRPDTRLSAWLFTTLANLCHNHHRWRRRHPTVSMDSAQSDGVCVAADEMVAADEAPPDRLAHQEKEAALCAAIDRLPHELKTALLLHHYEQLAYRDIARITGCSERGVETRLYRARIRLREDLSGWLGS